MMDHALTLAARGLGRVAPNPAVGAVLARDGRVIGYGWTQPGGRPHAETEALRRAGTAAQGATLYVTLEPCAHHGLTPPCTDAVIAAGAARVVAAIEDPDPRVRGQGLERLCAAGLDVSVGLCADAARRLNAGFISVQARGRPLVTLKMATSLDGRIADAQGASRWITGAAARARGHRLRADHDAIAVGRGTVAADDPTLTCRLPGLEERSPVRIVFASAPTIDPAAALVRTARSVPTLLIATSDVGAKAARLRDAGVEILRAPTGPDGRVDLAASLALLARDKGLTRILVEGGGGLAASLLAADLVDRIAWFQAPMLLGGDGMAAVAALGLDAPASAPHFRRVEHANIGADALILLERNDQGSA